MDVRRQTTVPVAALALAGLACVACGGGGGPTCTPGEEPFRFCSADKVYECPMGTLEQIEAKREAEAECAMEPDREAEAQCLLDATRSLPDAPAELVSDCSRDGQVCDDTGADEAGCVDP